MAGRGGWLDSIQTLAFLATLIPGPSMVAGALTRVGMLKGFGLLAGMIISSIPIKKPKGMENSASYGWGGTANKTPANGTPMPVIYGKQRVKPVLKNRYIAMEGDRQWLYALYSFAGHGIDRRTPAHGAWVAGHTYAAGDEVLPTAAILTNFPWWNGYTFICTVGHISNSTDRNLLINGWTLCWVYWKVGPGTAAITDIAINGNPITDYDPGALRYETRPGTAVQGVMQGFDVTYQNNYQGTALKPVVGWWNASKTYSVGEIVLSLSNAYACVVQNMNNMPPNASYWDDLGALPVDLTDMRYYPATYFTAAAVATISGTQLLVDINFPNGLHDQKVDATGTKYLSITIYVRVYYKKTTDGWDKSFWANNPARSVVTEQQRKQHEAGDDCTIIRNSRKGFHWTFQWEVTEGSYDVRIEYIVGDAALAYSSHYYEQTATLANVASLVYADLTYPGEPLLGIKVLATEKTQGDIEVTGVCERSLVWVHNGSAWVQLPANNHAWACYDLLVQGSSTHPSQTTTDTNEMLPPYGCGIPYGRIDYTSFKAWADLVGAAGLNYTLNIVFDDFQSVWEAITMICFEGRGTVMPYGAKYYAIPDQAASPIALLCEGNITAGSLTQAWGDRSKRVNSIEATYKDATRATASGVYNYDDVTFIARTAAWAADQSLTDAMRQTLYGTTNFTQAYSIVKYFLNCNEKLAITVNLELDVEGLNLGVGDVVNLQHAAMGLGVGGRIVGYVANGDGTSTIFLDRTVTLLAATTYGLTLRNLAGTLETHTDTVGTGEMDRVTFSSLWTTSPEAYSPYAFGASPGYIKLFRVVEARRTGEMKRRLTLLEYDASVYNIGDVPVIANYPSGGAGGSAAKVAPEMFNIAANLTLSEFLSQRPTGEYQSNIVASWTPNDMVGWGQWEVFVRDKTAGDPNWIGVWAPGTYGINEKVVKDGKAYISLVDGNTGTPYSI